MILDFNIQVALLLGLKHTDNINFINILFLEISNNFNKRFMENSKNDK